MTGDLGAMDARIQIIPRRRGLIMRPLAFGLPDAPAEDASLLGLVADAACLNAVPFLGRVLGYADIDTLFPASLPVTEDAPVDRLAFVLRLETHEVLSRMYPVETIPGRGRFIDFFGATVRADRRESRHRRVSPRSLRVSPRHRALWELRPFAFCPDSREELIDRCPVCERHLGWKRTAGVAFCDFCVDEDGDPTVDLRDHVRPLVEAADEAALAFACDLIHPVGHRRERARKALHPEFSAVGPGETFELLLALASAVETSSGRPGDDFRSFESRSSYARLTAPVMARAARVILSWPTEFRDLAEEIRQSAPARTGRTPMVREFGALAQTARVRHLSPNVRAILLRELDVAWRHRTGVGAADGYRKGAPLPEGHISQVEAAARVGMGVKTFVRRAEKVGLVAHRTGTGRRAVILYREDDVEQFRQGWNDIVDAQAVAVRLGVPPSAAPALAEMGLLETASGSALGRLHEGGLYARSSLERLDADLRSRLRSSQGPLPRLWASVRAMSLMHIPWAEVLDGVIRGAVAVAGGERPGPFARQVTLIDKKAFTQFLKEIVVHADGTDPYGMTDEEACLALGASPGMLMWLVDEGILETNGQRRRRNSERMVAEFKARFALTREIADRAGLEPRQVRPLLAAAGVEPFAAKGKLMVWERDTASAALARIAERACAYLTQKQAAARLLTNEGVVRALRRSCLITANGPGRATFWETDIVRFEELYMLSSMAAKALGVRTGQVRDRMAKRGFRPASVCASGAAVVWHRRDVERASGMA